MVVSSVRHKLTYDDLLRIPEDGRRHEILDGVHVVTAAPVPRHQRVHHRVDGLFFLYLRTNPLGELFPGPTDVLLSVHDTLEPDFVFVHRERSAIVGAKNIQGAPDLAIEILSPGTRRIDLGKKKVRYEMLDVGEYWILDPDQDAATIYRRDDPKARRFKPPVHLSAEADDRLTTPLLPGLEISLREIFAR